MVAVYAVKRLRKDTHYKKEIAKPAFVANKLFVYIRCRKLRWRISIVKRRRSLGMLSCLLN